MKAGIACGVWARIWPCPSSRAAAWSLASPTIGKNEVRTSVVSDSSVIEMNRLQIISRVTGSMPVRGA